MVELAILEVGHCELMSKVNSIKDRWDKWSRGEQRIIGDRKKSRK